MRKCIKYSLFLFFLVIVLSPLLSQNPNNINEDFDIKISITDTVSNFSLMIPKGVSLNNSQIPSFNSYYVKYSTSDRFNLALKSTDEGIFRTPVGSIDSKKATINLGFWNWSRSNIFARSLLSKTERYNGSYTSITSLFIEYGKLESLDSNCFLLAIPFENLKTVDSLFDIKDRHTRILFVLWKRKLSTEELPEEFTSLNVSRTNLYTGYTKYFEGNSINTSIPEIDSSSKDNFSSLNENIAMTVGGMDHDTTYVDINQEKIQWVHFNLKFKKIGQKRGLNFDYISNPHPMEIDIPKSSFDKYDNYDFDLDNDPFLFDTKFSKMWIPRDGYFEIDLHDGEYSPTIEVIRNVKEKKIELIFNGEIPNKLRFNFFVSSIFYLKEKEFSIKGNNETNQSKTISLLIPNTLLPKEQVKLTFQKPYNYNISSQGYPHDWKESTVDIYIDNPEDTWINLEFAKNPSFEFIYIDLSTFNDLKTIKDIIRSKVSAESNDFFIYVSNSGRPLVWHVQDDIDELLTQISFIRPEPPSLAQEKQYIKPYLNNLEFNKSRREVNYTFILSEAFLKYSSEEFISYCIDKDLEHGQVQRDNKNGKLNFHVYSTVEEERLKNLPIKDKIKIEYSTLK